MLILLLCALCVARVIRVGEGFEFAPTALRAAVDAAVAGDTIELNSGEYVLTVQPSGIALVLGRSITLRASSSAPTRPIIRVASSDHTDVVIGIGASGVRLENLIIGRPARGAPSNAQNIVAVLVSAGTLTDSSAYSVVPDYNMTGVSSRSAPVGQIRTARDAKRSVPATSAPPATDDAATTTINRALSNVQIVGVDFTASLSHTNIGFGTGAYVNARISQCSFAEQASSNAIVSAAGARFDPTSLVERNTFGGAPNVLNGVGMTIGANFWAATLRDTQKTFCIDRTCTRFGPVIDGDAPTRVFSSVIGAANAGVRRIVLTAHDVEWADDAHEADTAYIRLADTSIAGLDVTNCGQKGDEDAGVSVSNIHLRRRRGARPVGVVAYDGALSSVSNVQFTVHDGIETAISIVPAAHDKDVIGGTPVSLLLFDHVTIYGSAHQVGISVQSPSARVVLNEVEVFGAETGIVHRAGSLSVTDSVFVADTVGINVVGSAQHGLHVTNTLFFNRGVGVKLSDTKVSTLNEFHVSCSRFLFASVALPHDCADAGPLCAAGVRHNTFIVTPGTFADADRARLARGANHYEEDSIENAGHYYKFTDSGRGQQFAFALHDHQGRIDDASGVVTIGGGAKTHWSFMLATHIPMRQECFAATVPSLNGASGRVVSNLFDLRTDAPSACVSVALRVALRNADVDLQASEALAIYAVARVGSPSAEWTRAASHTTETTDDGASIAIDASSGAGALLRAVVVAGHAAIVSTPPPAKAAGASASSSGVLLAPPVSTPAHIALAVTRPNKQYCVACGGDHIPASLIDDRCGGGTTTPIFADIDSALAAVNAAKKASVALLVYGDKCVTSQCSIELGVMAPNKLIIEGVGPSERGSIRRPASCAAATSFVRVGTGVTLRYLLLAPTANVASAVPACTIDAPARQVEGPRLAYLTISGGVCIGRGRTNTVLLNNDISVPMRQRAIAIEEQTTGTTLDSNVIASGRVAVAAQIGIVNNVFGADAFLDALDGAQVTANANTFAARRADAASNQFCYVASERAKSQLKQNTFDDHCEIRVSGAAHQIIGGTWTRVRATLSAARLVGITLGAGSIVYGASGVVLDNVAIDLATTSVGEALRGAPMRTTQCAKQFEPALSGFALAKSSVYDAAGNPLFAGDADWPETPEAFVSYKNGAITTCVNAPRSDYCVCAFDKKKNQVKPDRQRVEPVAAAAAAAAAGEAQRSKTALGGGVKQQQQQQPKAVAPPGVRSQAPVDRTQAPVRPLASSSTTSHTVLWIVLGVGGGLLVCGCLFVVFCLFMAREQRIDSPSALTQTAARPQQQQQQQSTATRTNASSSLSQSPYTFDLKKRMQ